MSLDHAPMQFVPVTAAQKRESVVISQALAAEEMQLLDDECSKLRLEHALVGPAADREGALIDHARRDAHIAWIANNEASRWLYTKLMQRIQQANLFFGFDIWGFVEPFQYSEYSDGGRYCWHKDSGIDTNAPPRPPRKISFSLQMSEADAYEGGELQMLAEDRITFSRDRGTMIIFPSYMMHRANIVTMGVRKSLAGWVTGPDFR